MENIDKPELSYDIWLHIASYIPSQDHHRLLSVHRSFFDLALNRKYSHLRWTKLDEDFVYFLNRLQSPIISCRVRTLYLSAWFMVFVLKRDARNQHHTLPSDIFSFIWSAVSTCRPLRRYFDPDLDVAPDHSGDAPILKPTQLTASNLIRYMISAIRKMTNVKECELQWTEFPPTYAMKTLMTSIGTTIGPNLRKLILHAPVLNFGDLRVLTAFSVSVEELELYFDYSSTKATRRNSASQDLLATVLPLVTQSRGVMRSLLIFSSSSMDLSGFFALLPSIPHLKRFGVVMSFEKTTLSDYSASLLNFLRRHSSTLRHVCLSPNFPYEINTLRISNREVWDAFNEMLLNDMAHLSGLESLEIPFVSLDKTIPLLQRSADTLMNLVLSNHILSPVEVVDVLAVFSHRQAVLENFFGRVQTREYHDRILRIFFLNF